MGDGRALLEAEMTQATREAERRLGAPAKIAIDGVELEDVLISAAHAIKGYQEQLVRGGFTTFFADKLAENVHYNLMARFFDPKRDVTVAPR